MNFLQLLFPKLRGGEISPVPEREQPSPQYSPADLFESFHRSAAWNTRHFFLRCVWRKIKTRDNETIMFKNRLDIVGSAGEQIEFSWKDHHLFCHNDWGTGGSMCAAEGSQYAKPQAVQSNS